MIYFNNLFKFQQPFKMKDNLEIQVKSIIKVILYDLFYFNFN